ncbi:hypothetical protein LBMAG41_20910 [Cyanobium sp.]|nr:hypothetical protein LBMAG41_20910 [Cyanobium sp.]
MLESSGMKGRNTDNSNVTEAFAVNEAGQPRGYQRTEWEQSAALITAVPAKAPARLDGVGRKWRTWRPSAMGEVLAMGVQPLVQVAGE